MSKQLPITYPELCRSLTSVPGPRLTCYLEDRTELNGVVVTNWLNKTINLIADQWQLEAEEQLALLLPGHWRSLLWVIAAQFAGVQIGQISFGVRHLDWSAWDSFTPAQNLAKTEAVGFFTPADYQLLAQATVVLTDQVAVARLAEQENRSLIPVHLVDRHPFAWHYRGELPAGVADANQEVLSQPDSLMVFAELPAVASEKINTGNEDLDNVVGNGQVLVRLPLFSSNFSEATDLGVKADGEPTGIVFEKTTEERAEKPAGTAAEKDFSLTRLSRIVVAIWQQGNGVVLVPGNKKIDENFLKLERIRQIIDFEKIT